MVLDIKKGNEWQFLSKDGSCILPWYTRPALDVLESMDLSDKVVFEYGTGLSTIYYAKKCQKVFGIESDYDWTLNLYDTLSEYNLVTKADVVLYKNQELYIDSINNFPYLIPNIIVVDGIYRDECTKNAFGFANMYCQKGSLIILDNWLQPSVEVASKEVQDLVNNHEHTKYFQPGHPDWCTCIVTI